MRVAGGGRALVGGGGPRGSGALLPSCQTQVTSALTEQNESGESGMVRGNYVLYISIPHLGQDH